MSAGCASAVPGCNSAAPPAAMAQRRASGGGSPWSSAQVKAARKQSPAPVVPVRVSRDIPKARIFDVMREINKITVKERLGRGDAVITDVLGLGADVIITGDMLKK